MRTTKKLSTSIAALFALLLTMILPGMRLALADGGGGGGGGDLDASKITVLMGTKAPDANNPKTKGDAPTVEVTVIGAPNLDATHFSLHEDGAKQPLDMKPTSKRGFLQGGETVAVVIVLLGWEIWIGNDHISPDKLAPDDPSRTPGVLEPLKAALDNVKFTEAGPAGSQGEVITFADKVTTRVPMGPLTNITGAALGNQDDYFGTQGKELARAVETALADLAKSTAARKVLIIVCDGDDRDPVNAKSALQAAKGVAARNQVQVFGIIYRAAGYSSDVNVLTSLVPVAQMKIVNSGDTIASAIADFLARMADRQYLTFPGYDPKLEQGFQWDGKGHNMVLKIDKTDTDPVEVSMSPPWKHATGGGFPWLLVIIIVVAVLLLIIIAAKVFGSKAAPVAVAMPVVAAVAEAPKPAGPMKTVMIGIGGDESGFPVVGWLVPMNGTDAYRTYRLRSGGTKIGTAPPCDIIVNDGFMSTNHAMINCSPQGFTLIDGGSTNGCYVNDRKIVQKHELVDNDVVTLGKTNFKFKSIN
ncbi:MAG TPA: FHA domain-containing protein [Kofleriaceae bacterium]|jgi:hypothetical protein